MSSPQSTMPNALGQTRLPPQCVTAIKLSSRPRLPLRMGLPTSSKSNQIPISLYECSKGFNNEGGQPTPGPVHRMAQGTPIFASKDAPAFEVLVGALCSELNHFLEHPFDRGGFIGISLHYQTRDGSSKDSVLAIDEETWKDVAVLLRSGEMTAVRLSAYTWPKGMEESASKRILGSPRSQLSSKFVVKARH